ncbi:hypothetical protein ACHAW5_001216 [Stephanodiscus triporus]|uniref:Dolichyldiphosphatase n=1 Tax=Stephanodiscus triporus TaxID=2934178 RepID=A0ABD3MIC4_9STRA
MSSLGICLRWLCLLALVSYIMRFLVRGFEAIADEEGEMAGIFVCDDYHQNREITAGTTTMTRCDGLDDDATCDALAGGSKCVRSSCGRPLFRRIGVSYAGSSDPFDPDAATSAGSLIATSSLVYSLVCPYAMVAYFVCHFLASGNVISLVRLCMMAFLELANGVLFKDVVRQPRPTGSCLYFHSYGMPSGHACTSIGLLTFILLELFVDHPDLFGRRHTTMTVNCDVQEIDLTRTYEWGYGWQELEHQPENNSSEPEPVESSHSEIVDDVDDRQMALLSSSDRISVATIPTASPLMISHFHSRRQCLESNWIIHYCSILWTILLLPIPPSRVYLHDHSVMQVLVGCFVGVILGATCHFFIIRGRLWRSGTVNSRTIMEFVVYCRFGKLIGLNFGVDEGRIRMKSG